MLIPIINTSYFKQQIRVLLSTFALSPKNRQHLTFVLLLLVFASFSHHTWAQLSSSKEDPQQNLGLFSPVGTSLPETANNTGVQSTQNTPSLAMPFIALQNAPIEQAPKNGVPASLSKLYKEKKWDEALLEIAEISKKNPKNVQVVFIRSRILIEQGQLEQARLVLVGLTEKFPELPEPYNNLAVLYASAGKLDLAREHLEMCLKLAPKYAIAMQNLADVYTRIAAEYYGQAYQLNRRLTESDRKRKLIEALTKQ